MTTDQRQFNLKIVSTAHATNLPVIAAVETGAFGAQGLEVTLTYASGAAKALAGLADGEFDLALSDFDNLVAFRIGAGAQGEDEDGDGDENEEPDLPAVMGGSLIDLALVVAPDIAGYEDLRGKSLALDGLTSGRAFVTFELLARAGLGQGDFKMAAVGAAERRWQSVRDGEHAGTVIQEPYAGIARQAGCRILDYSAAAIGPLQGRVTAARGEWLNDNAEAVRRYVAGHLAGLDWALAPDNRGAATALLATAMPQIDRETAHALMASLANPESGLTPAGHVVIEGVETVLSLRERYGGHASGLGPAEDYLDLSIYQEIVGV